MRKNVLIIGAGNGGGQLLREISKQKELDYKIVGFLDDDPKKQKKEVRGISVLGTTEKLESYIKKYKIDLIFIAFPSVHGNIIRSLVERCNKCKVECRIIPKLLEIIHNKVSFNLIRPVSIEDLVGRPLVKSDQSLYEKFFAKKKVLITGAAGSIGSEITRQVIEYSPASVVMVDWWENGLFELEQELKNKQNTTKEYVIANLQDVKRVNQVFDKYKPDIVFHAAAFKHVPMMNRHPAEAVKNNMMGTQNVALAAAKCGTQRFVFISTDKAVNPTNIMGVTKSLSEALIQYYDSKYSTKFMTVRFGNVLGSYGSVVPLFKKQIEQGGPVTITHPDMIRFFMTIPEAAQLVLYAGQMGNGGEIYVLDMGEQMKIMDLAKTMIRLSGLEPDKDIKIKITGRRPGEKMYEELSTLKEGLLNTEHKLIFKTTKNLELKKSTISQLFTTIIELAENNKNTHIIKQLHSIFPTLISNEVDI